VLIRPKAVNGCNRRYAKNLSSSSTYNYQQADDYGRSMPRGV